LAYNAPAGDPVGRGGRSGGFRPYTAVVDEPVDAAPFTSLAQVYDAIMADIEYEEWGLFILDQLAARGWRRGRCLDLGCGTGNATFPLVARGLEVVGLDASADMLAVARDKLPSGRFVHGEFLTFSLPERFALVYSVFDSLNNLLTADDFVRMAERVRAHLDPGGFFMFDVNTTIGLRDLWESGRAEGWAGEVYYRWDHSFDNATGLARVEAYCETDEAAFTEVHYERPYDAEELKGLLARAGFDHVEAIVYPDGEQAPPDAVRIWVVARRGA
jgi:SAM-dependent methyltransferase